MVVAPDCGESHLGVGGAHWDAERRGRSLPVRGRVRVADHQAFPLQDNWLRVILSSCHLIDHCPAEHQYERVHHGALSLWQLWQRRFVKRDRLLRHTSSRVPPPVSRAADASDALIFSYWIQKCAISEWDISKKNIRFKSKPSFANNRESQRSPTVVCVSFSGLKLMDEAKVDHVECFRDDCSTTRVESVDEWSIALTPTPNNASDSSCSPQWCAACVRAQPSTLRTHMG